MMTAFSTTGSSSTAIYAAYTTAVAATLWSGKMTILQAGIG
jgi:hypothetical protein